MKIKFITLIFIIVSGFILCSCHFPVKVSGKIAKKGFADLTCDNEKRDRDCQSLIELKGEWEFYRNQFLTSSEIAGKGRAEKQYLSVPDNRKSFEGYEDPVRKDGYGTYHLRMTVADDGIVYGLKLERIYSAYRLYIDDKFIGGDGIIGTGKASFVPGISSKTFFFMPEKKNFSIILQISSYDSMRYGIFVPPVIGSARALYEERNLNVLIIFLTAALVFLMSAYHIIRFLLKREERTNLIFGVFGFMAMGEVLLEAAHVPGGLFYGIDYFDIERLQRFLKLLLIPLFFYYLDYFFNNRMNRRVIRASFAVSVVFIVVDGICPNKYLYVAGAAYSPFIAIFAGYALWYIIQRIRENENYSVIMLAGTMLIIIPAIYDLNIILMEMPENNIFHYGIMLFVLLQALVNSVKESKAFSKVEILSSELNISHQALVKSYMLMEKRVEERTAELKESNKELEHEIEIRKQVEQALIKAKAEAEATTVAKSTFLANMSHEIRTPLNGIVGLLQLLETKCESPEQHEYIRLMGLSADNLMNLISDILDFSRIESGKMELEQQEFNLHYLLQSHVDTFSHQVRKKDLTLNLTIDENVPERIKGDSGRLTQIINNLLSNAVKFTRKGGIDFIVSVKGWDEKGIILRFLVIDTGIGIPDSKKDIIFDSFSQADASTTRNYGGTGLGLSIAKKLVELMKGDIEVESKPGYGSRFTFTASFEVKTEEGNRDSIFGYMEDAEYETPPMNILVAEDDMVSRKLIKGLLESKGHTVSLAQNGLELLKIMKVSEFDCILMDAFMPLMDGLEATGKIREQEKLTGKHVPIIAITADALSDSRSKYLKAGMDAYVTKPVQFNKLMRVLAEIVEKSNIKSDNNMLKVSGNN